MRVYLSLCECVNRWPVLRLVALATLISTSIGAFRLCMAPIGDEGRWRMSRRAFSWCFIAASILSSTSFSQSFFSLSQYKGLPYQDSRYSGGPQKLPGKVLCAYYDLGGE